ncbi:MAG: hypothetical protein ACJ790_19390 [Myxococcaceae bacterium]
MIPDDLDLKDLTEELQRMLAHHGPVGYLRGKSLMRDILVNHNGFSQLEAEELIDTLELQGFLHFLGNPSERSTADAGWDLDPHN